jgi:transcriptional regulator with XRE-family HTH domain
VNHLQENVIKISLAAARVNAGLTQKELAKECNVSEATIINWESGKSLPSIGMLGRLESALGLSLNNIRFERKK